MMDYIQKLRDKYLNRNENGAWDNLVQQLNGVAKPNPIPNPQNKDYQFQKEIHPHFYSGQLYNTENLEFSAIDKILFVALNPHLGNGVQDESIYKSKLDFGEFIKYQNNIFNPNGNAHLGQVYKNCCSLLKLCIPDASNHGNNELLHNNAVIIDWLPFYSKNFMLQVVNDRTLSYFERIVRLLLTRRLIMIAGSPLISDGFFVSNLPEQYSMQNVTSNWVKAECLIRYDKLRMYKVGESYLLFFKTLAISNPNLTNIRQIFSETGKILKVLYEEVY